MLIVPLPLIPKYELVLLAISKMTVVILTQESDSVQEGFLMTPTRVETRPPLAQIMVIRRSRPWATFLFSDSFL